MDGSSQKVSCVHGSFEPFAFEFPTTTRDRRAAPAARTYGIFAVGSTTEAHAKYLCIRQFGEDFQKLCTEEAVSPDSESLLALPDTTLCSAEHNAVREDEAMRRVKQATLDYAAQLMQHVVAPNAEAYGGGPSAADVDSIVGVLVGVARVSVRDSWRFAWGAAAAFLLW